MNIFGRRAIRAGARGEKPGRWRQMIWTAAEWEGVSRQGGTATSIVSF